MYGDISLGDLPSGTYRTLTQEEINHLKTSQGEVYAIYQRNRYTWLYSTGST